MPMAGEGKRFSEVGIMVPKPYIEIQGKPFYYWAANSVLRATSAISNLVFIIQKSHSQLHAAKSKILNDFPSAKILEIDEVTGGALETALLGLALVNNSDPVLINDCDHAFKFSRLTDAIKELNTQKIDGFLAHFKSASINYSYAKYSDQGKLLQTAEKKVISDLAIAGIYGFSSRMLIENLANKYLEINKYSESYLSGLYNILVNDGKTVFGFNLDKHLSFGTPLEFEIAQDIDIENLIL